MHSKLTQYRIEPDSNARKSDTENTFQLTI